MFKFSFGEKGLSLLEVLVAMIVMSIGLLGIAPLIILSIEANNISEDTTIASNLVRDKIEYLEGLDSIPQSMYTQSETNVYITYEKTDGTLLASKTEIGFNRTTLIQNNAIDSLTPVGLLKVIVGIGWVDKVGVSRQTSITTYLRDK